MNQKRNKKHILLKCVLENCHEDLSYARQCSSVNNNKKIFCLLEPTAGDKGRETTEVA